jgi:hypothetical protein
MKSAHYLKCDKTSYSFTHTYRVISIPASVDSEQYCSGYVKLCVEKRPELWPNDYILYYDNAPAYKVLSVKLFLALKSIIEMEYSLFSPDLVPNDFWLSPEIKSALKGRRFQDTEDIHKNVTTALKAIPQQEFQKCFRQWQHCWANCIAAQGSTSNVTPLSKL